MLAKYKIEYVVPFRRQAPAQHYLTDDPVVCEDILTELLERKFMISGIYHEGVALPKVDFDRMLKTAAGALASSHLCASLGIDKVEANHRFGTPA